MTPKPILLVEDDRQLRDALAETLRLSGFRVLSAGNGAEALQVLAGTAVAAVVTDYQMEPMDGSALLARIRERWPQLPVLMITAYGSIEHAVASMMAGASDYLVKPFAAQTLVTRLERLVPRELPATGMVAEDPITLEALALAARVAASQGATSARMRAANASRSAGSRPQFGTATIVFAGATSRAAARTASS